MVADKYKIYLFILPWFLLNLKFKICSPWFLLNLKFKICSPWLLLKLWSLKLRSAALPGKFASKKPEKI